MEAAPPQGGQLTSEYWLQHRNRLFVASCIALIVTAMSFSIRADLVTVFNDQFHLSETQIGWVAGTAFWGFTLAMIIGGPLCDVLGMGRLLWMAAAGHAIGIFLTIFAWDFWSLFFGTLAIGLGNGFVEAACNPLLTTLFPDQKIKRLSMFHMWFPGGQVIGGLVAFAITRLMGPQAWQIKMATMLVPLVIYVAMFAGQKFPQTERAASGVSMGEMFTASLNPFFLLFVVCMFMTGSTELGTETWLPNILTLTTGVTGILFLVWITGLMAVGRRFAGEIVHQMSPIALLIASSVFSLVGLFLLTTATTGLTAGVAATIFAVGVCYYWPTMLGVINERFPKTGALGLAIMGGCGNLSVSTVLVVIGRRYDEATKQAALHNPTWTAMQAQAAGGTAALQQILVLPAILIVIFTAIYLYDRSHGGYKKELLVQEQVHPDEVSTATLVKPA